jgi:hypothetical protein
MQRIYKDNRVRGGTAWNSRVVAAIYGAHRFGVSRPHALLVLDEWLRGKE